MSVIANNILAGAAGQGGASAFTLEKSVRFNDDDDAYLSKTFSSSGNRKTYTMSLWVKRGNLSKSYQSFLSNPDSNGYNGVYFNFSSDYLHLAEIGSSNWTWVWQSAAVYRDPNAWYHIVAAIDTTQAVAANRVKVYVNGVQVTDFYPGYPTYPSQNFDTNFNNNTFHAIGRLGSVASTNYHYDGYIADFYFIDGSALDASSFGAFDSSGVWQAAEYSGTYGTNGFHLFDFASESGIGSDSSGNDNDFTANNLVGSLTSYSSLLTNETDADSWRSAAEFPAAAFDGSLSTQARVDDAGDVILLDVSSLSLTGAFEVYTNYAQSAALNDTTYDISMSANAWTTIASDASTVNTVRFYTSARARVNAVRVNGTILTNDDPATLDVLRDVPTNGDSSSDTGAGGEVSGNYATLNPLETGTNTTLANGNLEFSNSTAEWNSCLSTIFVSSGKWYCEALVGSAAVNGFAWGVAQNGHGTDTYLGVNNMGWALYARTSTSYTFHTATVDSSYCALADSDTLGMALDMDAGTLTYYVNGVSQGTAFTGITGSVCFAVTAYATGQVTKLNFGQRAFAYSAPSGYKALCTSNLPTPTIADGSDYFDTKLYTGNSSTQSIPGYSFEPDWVWIKSRGPTARQHMVYDQIRGVGKHLLTDGSDGEFTNANGLTHFNSDGFSLGNIAEVNELNATYAAWAWDAGSSNTSVSAGSLNSVVYDTSQTWSSTGTITNSSTVADAFDGSLTSYWGANANTVSRYTFASVYSGSKFELYIDVSLANTNFSVNGQSSSSVSGVISAPQWVDVTDAVTASNLGGLSYIEIGYVPAVHSQSIYAIRIDGKMLIDSNLTPANVPSIASTYRANQTAGFSIVSYTGTGANATVGHGIAAPSFIIVKDRDAGQDWAVWHTDLPTPKTGFLSLNTTDAAGNSAAYWNSTVPTSSVFSLGAAAAVNTSGNNYIAYCFAPVAGYSAFGKFTSNNSSDNAFVYLGFRPRFLIIKGNYSPGSWYLIDTARDPDNIAEEILKAETSAIEATSGLVDVLSNGFKFRFNLGTNEVLYAAWAENPFQANGGLAR